MFRPQFLPPLPPPRPDEPRDGMCPSHMYQPIPKKHKFRRIFLTVFICTLEILALSAADFSRQTLSPTIPKSVTTPISSLTRPKNQHVKLQEPLSDLERKASLTSPWYNPCDPGRKGSHTSQWSVQGKPVVVSKQQAWYLFSTDVFGSRCSQRLVPRPLAGVDNQSSATPVLAC